MTHTTNLPANQTSVYGTLSSVSLSNPLTVTFSAPITNFFLDVVNGNVTPVQYQVADNAGHSATFTLASNSQSGAQVIGFAATGTIITVAALVAPGALFDFFIDNITFNEALPDSLVVTPLPGALPLFASGLGALGLFNWRRKKKLAA